MKLYSIASLAMAFGPLAMCAGQTGGGDYAADATQATTYEMVEEAAAFEESTSADEMAPAPPTEFEQKLIKDGYVSLRSESPKEAEAQVRELTKKLGGYVSDYDEDTYEKGRQVSLTLRVPSAAYEQALDQVRSLPDTDLLGASTNVQDVTEEFVDATARLKAQRSLEERYLALLKQTTSMEDILTIEDKLTEVRSRIEQIEGRLRYLNNKVGLSTLRVTISEEKPIIGDTYGSRFVDGLRGGWDGFVWVLVGITYLWPFLVLVGVGLPLAFYLDRKRKKKR